MEYGLIRIVQPKETFVEDVLISLACYKPDYGPVCGYQCEVKGPLRDILCFISEEVDGEKHRTGKQLFRVYAYFEGDVNEVLVVGDSLRSWGKSFFRQKSLEDFILSMHITPSYPSDTKWDLMGAAAPGWVLLFEENLENAVNDILDNGLKVAYVSADKSFFETVGPDLSDDETLLSILDLILKNLPRRNMDKDKHLN